MCFNGSMAIQATKSTDSDLLPQLQNQYPNVNFNKFINCIDQGLSDPDISKLLPLSRWQVFYIRNRLNKLNQQLTHLRDNKVDYLLSDQLQSLRLRSILLAYFLKDGQIETIPDKIKVMLLDATNRAVGTSEDKQQVIINVKGNAQFNTVNLSPDEISQLQGNTSKQILDNLLTTPSVSGGGDDKIGDKKPENE